MARFTKKAIVEEESKLGRATKDETLAKWHLVAALHVVGGKNMSQAYMAAYGSKNASNASKLFSNPRFVEIVESMQASVGLDDDSVKASIEAFYLRTLLDEAEPTKNKLAAAQQWQKLRGLEKAKVEISSEADDLIMQQLKQCEIAMQAETELRAARGRVLRADALPVPGEAAAGEAAPVEIEGIPGDS